MAAVKPQRAEMAAVCSRSAVELRIRSRTCWVLIRGVGICGILGALGLMGWMGSGVIEGLEEQGEPVLVDDHGGDGEGRQAEQGGRQDEGHRPEARPVAGRVAVFHHQIVAAGPFWWERRRRGIRPIIMMMAPSRGGISRRRVVAVSCWPNRTSGTAEMLRAIVPRWMAGKAVRSVQARAKWRATVSRRPAAMKVRTSTVI